MARPGNAIAMLARTAGSVALVAAAVMAWQFAGRRHASNEDAAAAYLAYPHDAEAVSKAYSQQLTKNPAFQPSADDAANARAALLARPLAPRLLYLLAIQSGTSGKAALEPALMRLADRVSRRDPLNQVWLIEDEVGKGDVVGALRHYHAAMTVGPELQPMLLPVLASAIAYPEIRAALRPYIANHADWVPALLEQAAATTGSDDLADLVLPVAGSLTPPVYDHARASVMTSLALGGRADLAFAFASRTLPDLKSSDLRNAGFSPASSDPRMGSLAWSFPQTDLITSSLHDDGSLTAEIGQLAHGTLATRDMPVAPDTSYEFIQDVSRDGGSAKARLAWSGTCISRSGGTKIWDQEVPATSQQMTFRSVIKVPEDCHLLRLTASVDGADSQVNSSLKIVNIKFGPN